MNTENLSRSYLETLSFADLVELADDYGIDVPENLDRLILIGELLEAADEEKPEEAMIISSDDQDGPKLSFPKNYNETQISAIFRNPAWLFVFWNISESDSMMLKKTADMQLMIRICFLSSKEDLKPEEAIEVQATTDSQEQYVLIPGGKKFLKLELVYYNGHSGRVIAFSPVMTVPQISKYINDFQPGKDCGFSPIAKLSGVEKVLTNLYKNHRNSFM